MDNPNTPNRLRSACDGCHKLKRRCNGAMPCENCASLGSSCIYSLAGRLGRPRGSRSRRNAETIKSPRTSKSGPALIQDDDVANNVGLNNMLDLSFDTFDPMSSYRLALNPTQAHDAALSLFSTSEPDYLSTLDNSSLSQATTENNSPRLISPMTMPFEQQRQQSQHQDQRQHQDQHLQQQQQQQQPHRSQEQSIRQHPEPQIQTHFCQQQQQQQTQSPPEPSSPSRNNTPSSCQCMPGLSSLLHSLKRSGDDNIPPSALDEVLSRVSDALAQWSALAVCPLCQNHNSEDDDGETLLLAALSMRRVVAQLKAVGCGPGCKGFDDTEGDDTNPPLHVGAFRVTGLDRAILLGVLRTITARKLDAAVTAMQSMLRTKKAWSGKLDTPILHHIEVMLDDLAKTIKIQ